MRAWFFGLTLGVLFAPGLDGQRTAASATGPIAPVEAPNVRERGPGTVEALRKVSSEVGVLPSGLDPFDRFGCAVATLGDLDGDGVEDLAVGAQGDSESLEFEGAVWILFLQPDGGVRAQQRIATGHGGFTGVLAPVDQFGSTLASLGDLDGDSIPDLAVGTPGDEAVWLLFLRADGTVRADRKIRNPDDPAPGAPLGRFGTSVASIGDLDGDGVQDLAVGSTWRGRAGTVWVLFLNPDGSVKGEHAIDEYEPNLGPLGFDDVFGLSVGPLGDLDGDGLDDLAVGATGDDAGATDAGAVWVLFLDADGSVKSARKIGELSGGFSGDLLVYDHFGSAVAPLGDLDGDGTLELAVGTSGDGPNLDSSGAVWVLSLRSDGFVVGERKIASNLGGFGETLGSDVGFGSAVGVGGDLDGDGTADLLVGAPGDDDGAGDDFLNSRDVGALWRLALRSDATVSGARKTSAIAGDFDGIHDDAAFGRAVAPLGDLDGDGVVELAVGSDDRELQGAVWVFGLDPAVKGAHEIGAGRGGFAAALRLGDRFGAALAPLGDVDGDAIPDLAVGAPGDDDGGRDHGAVWRLLLNADGTVKSHRKISATQGGFTGSLGRDAFGTAVCALGDLDGDGTGDLAVGAIGDRGGSAERGALWLLFLHPDGTVKRHAEISGDHGALRGRLTDRDRFGGGLAVLGDLSGDGTLELAVGADGDDDGGRDHGAVWILSLVSDGTVRREVKLSATEGGFGGLLHDRDGFGSSLAAPGDLDGDGVTEILVGAPRDDDGGTDHGAVWVLFLKPTGGVARHQKISDVRGGFTGTLDRQDLFGSSISAVGDLNGDGRGEVGVGAPQDDDGGVDRGALWLLTLHAGP